MTNKTIIIADRGEQQLLIKREFDATRDLVFRAFCEADLLVKWMGPVSMKMEMEKFVSKTHGSWRFSHIDEHGYKYWFNGVIHESAAPERIIRTFEFEGLPEKGHVSLEFLNFTPLGTDRTLLTIQVVFKSVEDRDAMIRSGMERGVVESHNRLDIVLKDLKN